MGNTIFYDKSFDDDVDQDAVKPEYRAFAKTLHDEMRDRRMSVKELSEKTGIAQNLLSEYRNGKKFPGKPEALHKIASALGEGVTIDYLLGYSKVKLPDVSMQAIERKTGLSGDALFLLNKVSSMSETINSLCDAENRFSFIMFCQAVSHLSATVEKTEQQLRRGREAYSEYMESLALSLYRVEKLYREIPTFSAATKLLNELDAEVKGMSLLKFVQKMGEARNGEHQED